MQPQVVDAVGGVALQVSDLPQGSLHRELLTDNVQDALAKPSSANWAAQVVKHVRSLGLPAPFAHDGTVLIDKPSFRRHAGKSHEAWQGLHAAVPLGLRPPKGPSCARIIAGLHALVRCLSHTFSCS